MKSVRAFVVTMAAAIALTLAVSAQQSNANQQKDQRMQGMQSGQMQSGNMDQMMQNCRKTMEPMMNTNTQAKKDIENAKASSDPAKMRSALDEAEKAIDRMNNHMSTYMSMMNMMQNMHGMGGMLGGQDQKKEQTAPPQQ